MTERLQDIIDTFASVDDETRLELLLDYAQRLPPIPDRLGAQRDAGMNRVPECQTPVFLWIERDNGHVALHADVADEAPTVRGFLSIIRSGYEGATAGQLAAVPTDLVNRLGLSGAIRMQRAIGIAGMLGRIRREAAALAGQPA